MKPEKGSLLSILLDVFELKIDVQTAEKRIVEMLAMKEPIIINAKPPKPKRLRSIDSYVVANGKSGDFFFSKKDDKGLTAIASAHKRKIQTERVVLISGSMSEPKMETMTKCTLL